MDLTMLQQGTRRKPSAVHTLLGIAAGWAIVQGVSIPLSALLTFVITHYIRNMGLDDGLVLSISLLAMIGMWIVICIVGGYVAGMIAGRRGVLTAAVVGLTAALKILLPIQPEPMLFTYRYLLPATIVYACVIGGALVLSSDRVIDD